MPTPSPDVMQLLSVFAIAFTTPAWSKALVLLFGTILAPGRRTVTAALRAMGLGDDDHFTNYHRLLNRDRWSPWVLSKILLDLITKVFLPEGAPLLLIIDETLERRKGKKIKYKGWFRDPLRSTANHVSKSLGIRWVCLTILVSVPWSQRPWALPFMTVPALGKETSAKLGKRHRTVVGWTEVMISKVRRWQPEREIILVGDGRYAAVPLVHHCQSLEEAVKLTARLRLDARLFDPPGPQPPSKPGPKPKKGERQPKLADRLEDPDTAWQTITIPWYDQGKKTIQFVTGTALWHRRGLDPVPIRWVLLRCPDDDNFDPRAYFCSDPNVTALMILAWVLARWNIEVTFEELRAYLGFGTQRQWSDKAIERTTPCLFGVFSVVVLMAKVLHPEELPIRQASWYSKEEATFSDALAAVRRDLWRNRNCSRSDPGDDPVLISGPMLEALLETACYSN